MSPKNVPEFFFDKLKATLPKFETKQVFWLPKIVWSTSSQELMIVQSSEMIYLM